MPARVERCHPAGSGGTALGHSGECVRSDPRHGASKAKAEFKSGANDVSKWPEGLGIAATFSPEVCRQFGETIAKEYRALGITTALSPQIDLATEPRWMRFEDTFGTHPDQVTDLARLYCDGLQTTPGTADGWGRESVCAMAKHWPGGGPCEAGRDAHYAFGKYAVYPGDSFQSHLKPFTEGAFRLDGPTGSVSAIMPYYTVSWERDIKNGKNVGNAYSEYLIKDLLRGTYEYDGIVCTDWGVTRDPDPEMDALCSHCFRAWSSLTEAERRLLAIENGVDQFGGNGDIRRSWKPTAWAAKSMANRSCVPGWSALLCGCSRTSSDAVLFENPYLDPAESEAVVGCEAFAKAGYEAQLRSVVLVKNRSVLPAACGKKVYCPRPRHPAP